MLSVVTVYVIVLPNIKLNFLVLSAVVLSVIIPNVVAPMFAAFRMNAVVTEVMHVKC